MMTLRNVLKRYITHHTKEAGNFMRGYSLLSLLLILFSAACVDRINFKVGAGASPVAISGFISDQPGPYTIEITKAIEIDDKFSVKKYISAKTVALSDNNGTNEVLSKVSEGVYQTSINGIRGKIGNIYTLHVELLDGRIYESKPDTIHTPGNLENVYFNFKSEVVNDATQYGFDIFFNSDAGSNSTYRFLWKMIGTFQIDTNPELYTEPCGESQCPRPRACSGYVLNNSGNLEQVGPCTCCTCWISLIKDLPIVSDNELVKNGEFKDVNISYIPLDEWIFQHKINVEVRQMSLSRQSFAFWKAVIAQKEAGTSLFQPVTGKIPGNFIQIAGPQGEVEGLFFATGISSKSTFITRDNLPNQNLIHDPQLPFRDNCINFGNATTSRPSFWD